MRRWKKALSLLTALCLMLTLAPTAFAANDTESSEATGDKTTPGYYDENDGHAKQVVETFDFVENNIAYKIVDGGVEVAPWYWVWQHICYEDDMTTVVHHTNGPAGREYDGKSIEIPVTVTHNDTTYDVIGIRAAAFANVKNCTITFAAGTKISYIGINAFQYCQGTTMTIPATVKSIGSRCFESSDMDIKFEANSQLEEIGSYAFAESTSTAELVLPEGVTTVDEALFAKSAFSKVTIPGTVTNLTGSTLVNYTGEIAFTEGAADFQVQDGILYGYGKLITVREAKETVVVPEGITEIGATAFLGNTTMKSITLPDSLTTIGQAAFRSCTALESIVIPENVTELPAPNPSDKVNTALFAGCTSLKSVTIKAPVSEIPENAFSQCSSLESVTLPDTVETIGQSAFYKCTKLSNINMPDSLETIDKLAFAYCSSLAEADLPDGLETIGASAFLNCSSLKTIIIPEGVTEISQSLLGNCTGLETVVLPSTITSIGKYAFNGDFKDSGSTLIIKSETAPTVTTPLWQQNQAPSAENLTIIVPDGSESNYSAAGSVFKTYITTTTDGGSETTKDGISYKLDMIDTVSIVNGETGSLGTAIVPTGCTLSIEPSSNDVVTISDPDAETGAVTVTANGVGTVTLKFSIKKGNVTLTSATGTITVSPVTYTVSFNANGGTGSMADETGATSPYTLPACGFTAPDGMRFSTWAVNSTEGTAVAVNGTYTISADTTFYAVWENIPPVTYKVSFNANGGTGSMADVTGATSPYTLPACGFTAPNGKQFSTWAVDSAEGTTVAVGSTYAISADTTFYAVWENIPPVTYTVSFDANGGTGSMAAVTGVAGTYTLPACGFTAPDDKQFSTWAVDSAEGTTVAANSTYTISADTTFYAIWTKKPSSSGGSGSAASNAGSFRPASTTKPGETPTTPTTPATPTQTHPFVDVKPGDWYSAAAQYVYEKGLMAGISATEFGGGVTTTRGMIATMLYSLEGGPRTGTASFSDVSAGQYYASPVAWATANGVVAGYGDGRFGPNDTITREQLALILYNYAALKGYNVSASASLSGYLDGGETSAWAVHAMEWAVGANLLSGRGGGILAPGGSATRAEVAQILMNFCENVAE